MPSSLWCASVGNGPREWSSLSEKKQECSESKSWLLKWNLKGFLSVFKVYFSLVSGSVILIKNIYLICLLMLTILIKSVFQKQKTLSNACNKYPAWILWRFNLKIFIWKIKQGPVLTLWTKHICFLSLIDGIIFPELLLLHKECCLLYIAYFSSLYYLVVVIGRKPLRKITENIVCSDMFLITNVNRVHLPTWFVFFFSCAYFFLLWKISWCSQLNKHTVPFSESVADLDPRFQAPLFSAGLIFSHIIMEKYGVVRDKFR